MGDDDVKLRSSPARKAFVVFNYAFITLVTFTCLLPLINVLAMSFSSSAFVDAGLVGMYPRGLTLAPYRYVMSNEKFWAAFLITFQRLVLGVPISLLLSILMAYPLSKDESIFPARKVYIWFFVVCMIFNGGLVPTYLLVQNLNLIDSIWALVLPGGMNVFSSVILMNFFRGLPREIEESALLDGANHLHIMLRLYLPLSAPCIATITLFAFLGHWNAWMDGRIYMNFDKNYPLQTYLQSVISGSDNIMLSSLTGTSNLESMADMMAVNSRNLRASQIFISIIPVMCIYPFLQKYFTTGLVMGSVKG